jgi:bifunctional DNA-binding transcriptional regulator/antitoxin component of YhaV-PrlF toxin-antitoxin module
LKKDDPIRFLALLQAENRIQIPIEVRQHLKLESGKFLRIQMQQATSYSTFREEFFAKLSTDGRITVPWEVRWKLEAKPGQIMRLFLYPEDKQ